jgi:hypothetical protein
MATGASADVDRAADGQKFLASQMPGIERPSNSSAGRDLAFSLTEGGPASALLKRLHLVHPELGAGAARTTLILMGLTWLPFCLLCLIEGLAFSGVKLPFFYDLAAHTRFLFAVPVLVLADIPVGARLRQVVRHFLTANLVRKKELAKFGEIVLIRCGFAMGASPEWRC